MFCAFVYKNKLPLFSSKRLRPANFGGFQYQMAKTDTNFYTFHMLRLADFDSPWIRRVLTSGGLRNNGGASERAKMKAKQHRISYQISGAQTRRCAEEQL
jgi:hypothetical protein